MRIAFLTTVVIGISLPTLASCSPNTNQTEWQNTRPSMFLLPVMSPLSHLNADRSEESEELGLQLQKVREAGSLLKTASYLDIAALILGLAGTGLLASYEDEDLAYTIGGVAAIGAVAAGIASLRYKYRAASKLSEAGQ